MAEHNDTLTTIDSILTSLLTYNLSKTVAGKAPQADPKKDHTIETIHANMGEQNKPNPKRPVIPV